MESEKIKLEICCGTACYMLGASKLLKFEEEIPEIWKPYLDISAIPCLEACSQESLGQAPYVKINGKLTGNATIEVVYEIIQEMMREKGVIQ